MVSIRRYLFRVLSLTLVLITLLSVAAAYLISEHELEEILDAQLAITGRGLMSMLPDSPSRQDYQRLAQWLKQDRAEAALYAADGTDIAIVASDEQPGKIYHHEERKMSLGFWDKQGHPLLMGPGWHGSSTEFPAPDRQTFRWLTFGDTSWRVISMQDEARGLWLQLGIEKEYFDDITERVALNHLWPMLLLLPLCLFVMLYLIRRGLVPISDLSRQVEGRGSHDLAPIELPVPHELKKKTNAPKKKKKEK